MINIPQIKPGIVAVSRDCFPVELSQNRRAKVVESCRKQDVPVFEIRTTVENETDVLKALKEAEGQGINALVVYLGNFGPEGPATLMAQNFDGPVMFVAAAEETQKNLIENRGDAYCGLLSASYNMGLRKIRPFIPDYPVGSPPEIAVQIQNFIPIARIIKGLKKLKIFSFGPRPHDFLTCHAPIQPLYDIGVEIMENSELDLYDLVLSAKDNPSVKKVAQSMVEELGAGNTYPDLIEKLAVFEVALTGFMENNLGASEYGVFANKCWPAFEKHFGHVPCYINSRLAARGIPVACEADIYGALSEYMVTCATELPPALLDINNTVPGDMYEENREIIGDYKPDDLFMGFHCGNTTSGCLITPKLKYQLIMNRLMEPDQEPDITRGTLEGQLKAAEITLFRLQSSSEGKLMSYVANGVILDINPKSFGCIGVFAVPEMARFYRHVLIEHHFPHHTAVAFKHTGKELFSAVGMLGIKDIFFNLPKGTLYRNEYPF